MTQADVEQLRRALASEEGGRRWLRRLGVVGVLAVAMAGGLVYRAKHRPPAAARYVTQSLTQGDVSEKVLATGAVQPLLQVNVGSQVNGRVTKVFVDFNTVVKKGDPLAEIDPTVYGAQVSQTQAQISSLKARFESAKASHEVARVNYERMVRLAAQNLASKAELDTSKGQFDITSADMAAARAQIAATEAQLTQSVTNVGFTKIFSPVDGIVISRAVDPGATVVASFQTPTLFVIAQDLRKMRVMADVDEADVGKLKQGMDAEAQVDAFVGETFRGKVSQVRYSPNTVQGVVTYSAVVEIENADEKLRPGMTATVSIRTREVKGAFRVPNAALRYKPSPPLGADGKPVPQPLEAPLEKGKARVYLLTLDKPGEEKSEAKIVGVGITDGVFTELLPGALASDAKVVTDETDEADPKKKKGKLF